MGESSHIFLSEVGLLMDIPMRTRDSYHDSLSQKTVANRVRRTSWNSEVDIEQY